jgi:hypothetical protein
MKETLDTLQTLVLLMTLLLQTIMVLGIVYSFRLILQVLREFASGNADAIRSLLKTIEAPLGESKGSFIAPTNPLPPPPPPSDPAIPRAKCHRCQAKLPEVPKDSRIDGEATILIFKCGRCGKDTDVDANTGVVLTPPHAK